MIDPSILEEAVRNVYLKKFASELREMLAFSKSKELAAVWQEYQRLHNEATALKVPHA